jgi:hypothetical protein
VSPLLRYLIHLDRRWIFLFMAVAVLVPILARMQFEERPTKLVQNVFDKIESLPPGSKVLLSFDYDPASEPELGPMATAATWHCARKGHRIYFMALWAMGADLVRDTIDKVIKTDFPQYRYGVDYVNLGFKNGGEGVIRAIVSNLQQLYTTDNAGTSLSQIPMTRDLVNIRGMDLIFSFSAGSGGCKEWVQYAATPYHIPAVAGCTGVQAPLMYPYIPNQMLGLLGAIKGAAEYEAAVGAKYPEFARDKAGHVRRDFQRGIWRMGPQLIAHCLILVLIVLGNVVLFLNRRAQRRAA